MNTPRTAIRLMPALGVGLLWILAAGCDKEQNYVLHFSHFDHIKEYEVACTDCHGKMKDGRFNSISHSSCSDCHDEWIDTKEIGEKTCGHCHKQSDLKVLNTREAPESAPPLPGVFVHTTNLADRCTDCHGALMTEGLTQVPAMKGSERTRIRTQAHASGMACDACHVAMSPDVAPQDHQQNWTQRHGQRGLQADNACSVCHTEQSCRECHQETMPASHNNLWRMKTHSVEASWDRARCMTCHEEDSCTACHSEVRPQSHNAAWERTHCQQCHVNSSAGTGCAFCHEGGLDAHPDPHAANWRETHCRNCHNGTPESEQCSVCHGGNLLANHANPHGAGWRSGHCTQCHDGQVNGVSCETCHGRDLAEDHPNPHPAGFSGSHCNTCHEGATVNGVRCEVCHGGDVIGNHPNPHASSFERTHCDTCHAGSPAADKCAICHEGGNSVLVHEDFWPPVHNRFGAQADCNDCH